MAEVHECDSEKLYISSGIHDFLRDLTRVVNACTDRENCVIYCISMFCRRIYLRNVLCLQVYGANMSISLFCVNEWMNGVVGHNSALEAILGHWQHGLDMRYGMNHASCLGTIAQSAIWQSKRATTVLNGLLLLFGKRTITAFKQFDTCMSLSWHVKFGAKLVKYISCNRSLQYNNESMQL